MEDLDWDERALIDQFKSRLKDTVRKELMRMTIFQDASRLSLEEWIEFATKTDDILFATRSIKDNNTPFRGKTGIEQGKVGNKRKDTRVPKETIDRRRKEGKCFKCGRKNHMAKECKTGYRLEDAEPKEKGKVS